MMGNILNTIIVALSWASTLIVYNYIVGYTIIRKKPIPFLKMLIITFPLMLMYTLIICLFDSMYVLFFNGICSFFYIKKVFDESIFVSIFVSMFIHTFKLINKILLLKIISNPNLLLFNTYKTIDWTVFFINLSAMSISLVVIIILRKYLRKMIKFVAGLKQRNIVILVTVLFTFCLAAYFHPIKCPNKTRMITDIAILYTITAISIFSITNERKIEDLSAIQNLLIISLFNTLLLK